MLAIYHDQKIDGARCRRADGGASGSKLLNDTGLLPNHHRGGRGSALEIHNGRLTAIYEGERSLLEPTGPRGVEERLAPTADAFFTSGV